jgi:hypothetical protein
MKARWNDIDRRNQKTQSKSCPSATLSTTNSTWTDLDANPSLRGEKRAINRLSRCTDWKQKQSSPATRHGGAWGRGSIAPTHS